MQTEKHQEHVNAAITQKDTNAPAARNLAQEAIKELWTWITDEKKRKTLNWLAAVIGGAFVVGYYQSLNVGFTPSIDLGSAMLLFVQAFLFGVALLAYLCAAIFSPAYVFHLSELGRRLFTDELASKIKWQLLIRNLAAQLLTVTSFLLASIIWNDATIRDDWRPDFYAASLIADSCAAILFFLYFCGRVETTDYQESKGDFSQSVGTIMTFTFISIFIVWALSNAQGNASNNDRWTLYSMWLFVAVFSALFSITITKRLRVTIPFALAALFLLLVYFNSISLPVRVIASAIGIAAKEKVTLVLPPDSCESVAQAITTDLVLDCDERTGGVLHDVWLRNQLGDRWIIQETENSQSIIFDGKGVTMRGPKPFETKPKKR